MSSSPDDIPSEPEKNQKTHRKKKQSVIQSAFSNSGRMSEMSEASSKTGTRYKRKLQPIQKRQTSTIDVTSDDISEITNSDYQESKSDGRSYRDKLKNRFLMKKRLSEKSLVKDIKMKTFRSHANNILTLNRSIDMMKKENLQIETQMKGYRRSSSVETSEGTVSKAEKYQFFCESLPATYLTELFMVEETTDLLETNKSTEVLIQEEETGTSMVLYKKPECKINNIIENELQLFWTPSRKRLQPADKVDGELRQLRDEGIYVPKQLKMRTKHLNILEQRLLLTNDKRWFSCSGEMIVLENPYSKISYRPDYYSTTLNLEVTYKKPTLDINETTLNSIVVQRNNILEISIHNIKFKHHPLFSPEHVLQENLITCYDTYREFISRNKIDRLHKKLEMLRKAGTSVGASGDFHSEQNYNEQIKICRNELFQAKKLYRNNITMILYTWKHIKLLREKNGFSSTSIKLEIRKVKDNFEQEKLEHKQMYEQSLTEMISEQERDYNKRLIEYKTSLIEWKKLQENEDSEEPKPQKPSKHIDTEKIRHKLSEEFEKCFKEPGEPDLRFTITYDNEITKLTNDTSEETRQNAVKSTKVFLKFFCNDMEVCKSKVKSLSENFVCHFEESFSLKLTHVPEMMLLEIYEQHRSLVRRKVAEVQIKVPTRNVLIGQCKVVEENFVRDELVRYKHNGVGSGVKLIDFVDGYDLGDEEEVLNTSGFVTCNIGWDAQEFDTNAESDEQYFSEDVLDANGAIDVVKLHKWIDLNQPDPQDPRNAVIFDYVNYSEQNTSTDYTNKKYFRCDPYLYPMEICSKNDLEENIRFKLLGLRDKNVPEFVGMVVPNRLNEIPTNIFSTYERRIAEENHEEYLREDDYEHEINSQRSYGRKYIRQMHTKIFELCRNSDNNLSVEDVLNEKTVPLIELYIKTMVSNVLNWFRIQPSVTKPLPSRRLFENETSNIMQRSSPPKITICLKNGVNVPMRKDQGQPVRRKSGGSTDSGATQVKPFIEVNYQQFVSCSNTGVGKNPTWGDEIQFPLEMVNTDYLSPHALNGSILCNLFDDISENGEAETDKTAHWLGSVQIPVSAVAETKKLEGLFLVRTPVMIFGYEQEKNIHHDAKTRLNNTSQSYANYTYINMTISIEPNIPKLSPDMESLPSCEPPYVRDHILQWNSKYNTEHSHRKFSAFAIDSNGKTVCITRYIKSLEPPQINADGFDVTPDQCSRYVSMIPFTDSNKFYQNIWLTTEQMLKLGIGSVIDHAVALTCYFLTLNMEAWLLLGFGIPHGSTAFVLVREHVAETMEPNHFVYDTTNGLKYNVKDPHCPLQKVYCVVNDNNLWANVQRGDEVASSRFDFSRRFDWLPLFNRQVTAPTNSFQEKLLYVTTYDMQKMQGSVEKKLKRKIAKLRAHERTVWNHYMCGVLKNAMNRFEVNLMHGKTYLEIPEVQEIMGCLINVPFQSVSSVVEKVVNTRLHQEQGMNVEFAIGVYVHPYPNQVVAIWVALLRIIKKH